MVRYLQHSDYSRTIIYIYYNQWLMFDYFGLPIALAHSETVVTAWIVEGFGRNKA